MYSKKRRKQGNENCVLECEAKLENKDEDFCKRIKG